MRVLVAGDYAPLGRVSEAFSKGQYESVLKEIRPLCERNDISLVNFEITIPQDVDSEIEKCGPCLKCEKVAVDALKWAGFNVACLANNHILDYGAGALRHTLSLLKAADISTVGAGENLEAASRPLIMEIDGVRLAIINCAEHEFSIATDHQGGANPLNPIRQYYEILKLRKSVDYILVYVHGGREHYQLPTTRMQETYRFFIDAGADAVVNAHQHCISGYEIYGGKPIVYGLGNFCFDCGDKLSQSWYEGMILELEFNSDGVVPHFTPYEQCKKSVAIHVTDVSELKSKLEVLNTVIYDSAKLRSAESEYSRLNEKGIMNMFQPYNNRWLKALYYRNLLPSLMGRKRYLKLKNYLLCQSHYDVVKNCFLNR